MKNSKEINIELLSQVSMIIILYLISHNGRATYKELYELLSGEDDENSISKPALSQTLARLEKYGIIRKEKFGKYLYVELNKNIKIYKNKKCLNCI